MVLVITSQSLKARLNDFQTQDARYGVYKALIENLGAVYIDEAHHLGAEKTQKAIEELVKDSKAFLFGATATPIHHQLKLDRFFDRQHWSYLNTEDNLFEVHGLEKVLEQLYLSINSGDITPFDDLYVIGEDSFFEDIVEKELPVEESSLTQEASQKPELSVQKWEEKKAPVFIQRSNLFYVLNPEYYESLNKMLAPLFEDNRKGFIVTGSIEEAESISDFLNRKRPNMEFEAYHSKVSLDERRQILKRSRESNKAHYIVAVDALNEGVDLPHLSAYVDLNANISIKEMIHRIGRVLRVYPEKLRADILFLINYRNERMIGDVLKVLEAADEISFKGRARLKRQKRRSEGLEFQEGIEKKRMSREELKELRKRLKDSVRSFWNTQEDDSFLKPKEVAQAINKHNETASPEKMIITITSYNKNYRSILGAPSHPWKFYGQKEWENIKSKIDKWKVKPTQCEEIIQTSIL